MYCLRCELIRKYSIVSAHKTHSNEICKIYSNFFHFGLLFFLFRSVWSSRSCFWTPIFWGLVSKRMWPNRLIGAIFAGMKLNGFGLFWKIYKIFQTHSSTFKFSVKKNLKGNPTDLETMHYNRRIWEARITKTTTE